MSDKIKLLDEELDDVTGGRITYTWDGTQGSLGINGNNPYILLDKQAFINYYNSVKDSGMKDAEIIKNLRSKGIIKLP